MLQLRYFCHQAYIPLQTGVARRFREPLRTQINLGTGDPCIRLMRIAYPLDL